MQFLELFLKVGGWALRLGDGTQLGRVLIGMYVEMLLGDSFTLGRNTLHIDIFPPKAKCLSMKERYL